MPVAIKASDHDYNQEKNHPSSNEVGHPEKFNTTQPACEESVELIHDAFQEVEARWKARCLKDGTKVFHCPLCPGPKTDYPTKKDCGNHIRTAHSQKIAVLKHEGKPAAAWAPVTFIKAPKRTLADCLPAKQGERIAKLQAAAAASAPLMQQALRGGSKDLTASRVIVMIESLACLKVRKLDNTELARLAQMSNARGRRRLTRACRLECEKRGVPLNF